MSDLMLGGAPRATGTFPLGATSQGARSSVTSLVQEVLNAMRLASWPARLVATYVVLLPMIAGIPRGQIFPMLRLTEVAQVGLTGLAVVFAAASYAQGKRWRFVLQPLDWCMVALAFFGSAMPLVSLIAREQALDLSAVAAFVSSLSRFGK